MSFVTIESAHTVEEPQTVYLGGNLGNFPFSQMNLNHSEEDDQLILLQEPTASSYDNFITEVENYQPIDNQTVVSDFRSPKAIRAEIAAQRRDSFGTEKTGATIEVKKIKRYCHMVEENGGVTPNEDQKENKYDTKTQIQKSL